MELSERISGWWKLNKEIIELAFGLLLGLFPYR